MSFTAEAAANTPAQSVMELPRRRLYLAAAFWLSFNIFQAISYASGLAAARKALHDDWQYVIAGLAYLGVLGMMLVLVRQLERCEVFAARKFDGSARIVRRCSVVILLAACVAAPIIQRQAIKSADELRDALTAVTPCGASLCAH